MIENSSKLVARLSAAVILSLVAACSVSAGGQIPCADDSSCPADYPVCSGASASAAGKCIAGSPAAATSVAVVGVDGHAASDFLSGTVRVLVTARASTGVGSVTLSSGAQAFPPSATAVLAPLFAFDVDTTALANADVTLTAALKAGDGTVGTATGILHVDNVKPVIASFTVGGGTSATITAGKTIPLTATFTGGTGTITASVGGSVTITSGASVLVAPDIATTYSLRIVSRSGVAVATGAAGQPGNVTIGVTGAVTVLGGTFHVTPSIIQQGQSGNLTFTAPAFGSSVFSAVVKDESNTTVGTITTSGGSVDVPIPVTSGLVTQLTYTLVLANVATTPDTLSFPVLITVGVPPTISSFSGTTTITAGGSATLTAAFAGGNGIINPGNIPLLSTGAAVVVPSATQIYVLTVTNPVTNGSVQTGTGGQPPNVTVTVVPAPGMTGTFAVTAPASATITNGIPGTLSFSIPNLSSVAVASLKDDGGFDVLDNTSGTAISSATIIAAGGGTLSNVRRPASTVKSALKYTLRVSNSATLPASTSAVTSLSVVAAPAISAFSAAASTITNGRGTTLSATFTGGTGVISPGNIPIVSGSSVAITPTLQQTYTLTVTNAAGTAVTSNPTPGNVTVSVVAAPIINSFSGSTSNTTSGANLTFKIDTSGANGSAVVVGSCIPAATISAFAITLASGTGTSSQTAPTVSATSVCTYTASIQNAATTAAQAQQTFAITVEPAPLIVSFTFQSSGTNAATFAPGTNVVLNQTYQGGTATINAVTAGASGGTTTFNNIQASTTYTLTVTNPAGTSTTATATATVSAQINNFSVGAAPATALSTVNIGSGNTTTLFATFGGSGATGNASGLIDCAPGCNSTLSSTSIFSGGTALVTGNINGTLTYTLTVTPSTGTSSQQSVTVNVIPVATATSLTVGATLAHGGNATTLTPVFSFNGAVASGTATISDGSLNPGVPVTSGVPITVSPTVTTTYTLNVVSAAGIAAATAPTATVSPGSWIPLNTTTNSIRVGATVTAFANGKILVAGGMDGTTPTASAVVCDPSGTCASAGTMGTARAYHAALLLTAGANAGKVLLTGGFTATGPATPTTTADLYDPSSNAFSATTAITTGATTTARARHIMVATGTATRLLVAGGTDGAVDLSSAINYNVLPASPTTSDPQGPMAQARATFTGTLLGTGKILIVGGKVGNLVPELFDPLSNGLKGNFSNAPTLPSGEDKIGHTAVKIASGTNAGEVLVSGGTVTTTGPTLTQFLYDPGANSWATVVTMSVARSGHAAISLGSAKVLLCGGTNGTLMLSSCETFDPATLTEAATAAMLASRKDFGLANILMATILEVFAAGGTTTATAPTNPFAETYNPN